MTVTNYLDHLNFLLVSSSYFHGNLSGCSVPGNFELQKHSFSGSHNTLWMPWLSGIMPATWYGVFDAALDVKKTPMKKNFLLSILDQDIISKKTNIHWTLKEKKMLFMLLGHRTVYIVYLVENIHYIISYVNCQSVRVSW